jgi:hypothetical protein
VSQTSSGALARLNAEASYLATCQWGLYTDQGQTGFASVLSDRTEAAWAGYVRQIVGAVQAAALVGRQAQASPAALPNFVNSSGAQVGFYGWLLLDPTGLVLLDGGLIQLAAGGVPVQQLLPAGATYTLVPVFTDRAG